MKNSFSARPKQERYACRSGAYPPLVASVPSQSPLSAVYKRLEGSRVVWLSLFVTAASAEGYELNPCQIRTYETGGDGIRFPPLPSPAGVAKRWPAPDANSRLPFQLRRRCSGPPNAPIPPSGCQSTIRPVCIDSCPGCPLKRGRMPRIALSAIQPTSLRKSKRPVVGHNAETSSV